MNEEQKNELMEVLIGIAEKGEQVTTDVYTILQEQSPQLVQEILNWGFFTGIAWGVLVGIACVALLYPFIKLAKETIKEDEIGILFFAGMVYLIPIAISFSHFADAIKICIAPRLYMIEYIKGFIG